MNIKRKHWFSQAQTGLEEKEYAMSTTTLNFPNVTHANNVPMARLIAILIVISLLLIAGARVITVLSTVHDPLPANQIPASQNSINPIPVPTPPAPRDQLAGSETPALPMPDGTLVVVAVPVPTPPAP
jgi:hypothetical protein